MLHGIQTLVCTVASRTLSEEMSGVYGRSHNVFWDCPPGGPCTMNPTSYEEDIFSNQRWILKYASFRKGDVLIYIKVLICQRLKVRSSHTCFSEKNLSHPTSLCRENWTNRDDPDVIFVIPSYLTDGAHTNFIASSTQRRVTLRTTRASMSINDPV